MKLHTFYKDYNDGFKNLKAFILEQQRTVQFIRKSAYDAGYAPYTTDPAEVIKIYKNEGRLNFPLSRKETEIDYVPFLEARNLHSASSEKWVQFAGMVFVFINDKNADIFLKHAQRQKNLITKIINLTEALKIQTKFVHWDVQ